MPFDIKVYIRDTMTEIMDNMKVLLYFGVLVQVTLSRAFANGVEIPLGGNMVLDCGQIFNDHQTMVWYDISEIPGTAILQQNKMIQVNLIIQGTRYSDRINNTVWGVCVIKDAQIGDSTTYDCVIGDVSIQRIRFAFKFVAPPQNKPDITEGPIKVAEGQQNVEMTCQLNGENLGKITYTWRRNDGKPVSGNQNTNTGTLTFQVVHSSDKARYICIASNIAGYQENEVELDVHSFPRRFGITSYENGTVLYSGENKETICQSEGGDPLPSLTMTCMGHEGEETTEGTTITTSFTAQVTKSWNRKRCECTATQELSSMTRSTSVIFTVYYPPGTPSLQAESFPWVENKSYQVTCMSTEGNPQNEYKWTKAGTVALGTDRGQLVLVTNNDNQKELKCQVENNFTRHTDQEVSKGETMDIEFSPRVSVGPDITQVEGGMASVVCLSVSNPPARPSQDYMWTHGGDVRSYRGQNWTLGPVDKTFTGRFTCTVKAPSTKHSGLIGNGMMAVTVQYIELNLDGTNVTVEEYARLQITCNGEGVPASISFRKWLHKRQGRSRELEGTPGLTNQVLLIIERVQYDEDGVYTCRAYNAATEKERESYVIVHYPPKRPNHEGENQFFTNMNTDFQIVCNVSAVPENVVFMWYHSSINGSFVVLQPGGRIQITNSRMTSQLIISNFTYSDYGNYTVYADNQIRCGTNFTYMVNQRDAPGRPIIARDRSYTTAVSVYLSWQASFDGGYSQTFSVFYKELPGGAYIQAVSNISDPGVYQFKLFRVTNLNPSTRYQFKVQAHNEHKGGSVTQSSEEIFITKDQVSVDNSNMKVEYDGEKVHLRWPLPQGSYDTQIIEQRRVPRERKKIGSSTCRSKSNCVEYKVPIGQTNLTVQGLQANQIYTFDLVLYDDGDEVGRQGFPRKGNSQVPILQHPGIIAGFVGGTLGFVAIITIVILLRRRKRILKESSDKDVCPTKDGSDREPQYENTTEPALYENVKDHPNRTAASAYEELSKRETEAHSGKIYQQLSKPDEYELLEDKHDTTVDQTYEELQERGSLSHVAISKKDKELTYESLMKKHEDAKNGQQFGMQTAAYEDLKFSTSIK